MRYAAFAIVEIGLVAGLSAFADAQGTLEQSAEHAQASSDLAAVLEPQQWAAVEGMIDRGLKWLSTQQRPDGSFDGLEPYQPAVTCLAVMAFLSRGHVPDQGPYGTLLTHAVDYILSTQQPDGSFSKLPWGPPFERDQPPHTLAYNHAITGLTLGEVYGMTAGRQEAGIRTAIGKALEFSRSEQAQPKVVDLDLGGWRYAIPADRNSDVRSDLSVTSWELMFLRSARNAEFHVPQQHVEEAISYVLRCYEPNAHAHRTGVFRYSPHGTANIIVPSVPMTGAGMLCLQLSGHHDHEFVRAGADWLRDHPIPSVHEGGNYYYGNYYCSQAMAQMGGDYWKNYFPRLVADLRPLQLRDGSWDITNAWEWKYGACYCTSMAVLSLTPPYQLLPIYQR